ncbi:MAG: T9SS type A sorting domain-containing protein [Bacteroidota bacterium]
MTKKITGIALLLGAHLSVFSQQFIKLDKKKEIVCYADFTNKGTRILPVNRSKLNARVQAAATFQVEYIGFTQEAEVAFQAAVDIWADLISSPVPINIEARWEALDAGVLGSAIWGNAFGNFTEAQKRNTFYPVALAEKMSGRNLNGDDPDIVARFSSSANWYFGTDANPTESQFDLVSVVLHEIGHGLGFTDSFDFDENSEQGSFGFQTTGGQTFSIIYDTYVENAVGDELISGFASPSIDLGNELTSDDLFFDSEVATSENITPPRIFAPTTWNAGSSIAHLNETTYPSGTPNSLMTPQIAANEVMQDPGPITLNMLGDMGWEFLYITPDRGNSENPTATEYPVLALIEGDNDVASGSVMLHYSLDNFSTDETIVEMLPTTNPNEYAANIPSTGSPATYFYFIEADDSKGRTFSFPGAGPENAASFVSTENPDVTSPEVTHTPPGFVRDSDTELLLEAIVKDFLPLSEVRVDYSIGGNPVENQAMILIDNVDSLYQVAIDLSGSSLSQGDVITYSITAIDESINSNSTVLPATGSFELEVVSLLPSAQEYSNDFNAETDDFISSGQFSILTPDGFVDGAIHSEHPYSDGTGANDESNYTMELRVPIIVSETDALITFDEIVLVEPGETGSVFGDDEFWDYAIVEGSKDGGRTWLPFADGYDARDDADWLQLYNSTISNNNSTGSGTRELFKSRTIDILESGDFMDGDEVLVRFRLFADQAAHGWGWAIDNLAIQIDNTAPEILHDHIDVAFNDSFDIVAEISDNRSVDSVAITLFVNDIEQEPQVFDITIPEPQVNTTFTVGVGGLNDGDTIKYRYVAFDPDQNVTYLPAMDDFFKVLKTSLKSSVPSYSNNFDSPTTDFFGNYFSLEQPTGYNSLAIHSTHPYPLSFGLNGDSDFSYILLQPITITSDRALMAFDEVVLVEPSSVATFGSPGFLDFVVVEGSKDGGVSWIPFEDGYDARDDNDWLTSFTEGTGSEELSRYRIVNMFQSGEFESGDEVLIQFRLNSNETVNGWGWSIDNLEIQTDAITSLASLTASNFNTFPNPLVSETLNISFDENANLDKISIELIDLNGRVKSNTQWQRLSRNNIVELELSNLESGIYMLKISTRSSSVTQRIIKQ